MTRKISRKEVEPQMKREIGKTDRQNSLMSDATGDGPDTRYDPGQRSECGKGKTCCYEEMLVTAQNRRQRKE
jgi:hypothetical protein